MTVEQRVVVVGASAGGVDALIQLARNLPRDFPAPVCMVLHIPADSPSLLPDILNRDSPLQAMSPENGQRWEPGKIYIAPPDRHLLISNDGTLQVARGPRENRHRPAVDPLFRSAALGFGPRAIGVVLSGTLDDGTAGLIAIKQRGGLAIVQDPSEALYPGMPESAIAHTDIDHIVAIRSMGTLLMQLVSEAAPAQVRPPPRDMGVEVGMANLDAAAMASDDRPGDPSPYSCPDCGGVLWEIKDGEFARYRCRIGHAFNPETMLGAQEEVLEEALWSASKTLEETARLSRRLAGDARSRGNDWLTKRFEKKEREARERVELIRRYLLRDGDSTVPIRSDG